MINKLAFNNKKIERLPMSTFYRMSLLVFLATCLGIGIFRFSYTALMPIMIVQYGWTPIWCTDLKLTMSFENS